jgi:DNA-binding Lrp family transcriptional regulator
MTLAFLRSAPSHAECLRYVLPVPTTRRRKDTRIVSVNAYILIQTEVGKAASVTGPYDVIVRAEAESVDDLGKLVVANVQAVAGITRTLTCPVVHL